LRAQLHLVSRGLRTGAAALVLVLVAAGGATHRYREEVGRLNQPMHLGAAQDYEVPQGASFSQVSARMAQIGWVESPRFFAWYARHLGKARAVKAGTYRLAPGMSALDALALFVSGREVQYAFTIVEGWTFRELRAALAGAPQLTRTLPELDDSEVMAALGRPGRHPEGMFLADTYHFPPRTTDRAVLARAMAALERTLQQAWSGRPDDLPLEEPYQGLVLASIIEKETAAPHERSRIAGVFIERLRRGMLLQTDPTVIYGMGTRFDGNLRRRDLETDTPYNTYTRKGLPPTPIALVGREALAAAFHPLIDGTLFFVSRGDGSHQFSRTYAEHQRAVRRYQLGGGPARKTAAGGSGG
jgi:UPF0755 protein